MVFINNRLNFEQLYKKKKYLKLSFYNKINKTVKIFLELILNSEEGYVANYF